MQVQNITTNPKYLQNKPTFGLRISDVAAVSIVHEFKKLGASDDEVVYYLKTLRTSKPDKFEMQKIDISSDIKNTDKGDKLSLKTVMWMSDNKKSGEFIVPRTYDFEEDVYSNAESKAFLIEHLIKSVNKATEKMQRSFVTPSLIQKYKYIINKSEV